MVEEQHTEPEVVEKVTNKRAPRGRGRAAAVAAPVAPVEEPMVVLVAYSVNILKSRPNNFFIL